MKISILTPTRGRPQRLATFIKSLDETASGFHEIEVVLGIDEDDEESIDFSIATKHIKIVKTVAPRDTMGSINTRCFNYSTGEILLLGNDDIIVKTEHWDRFIFDSVCIYDDEVYLAYPNDGHKSKTLSTFPIISRRCAKLLVDPYPHEYQGSMIDLHINEIFDRLKKLGFDRVIPISNVLFEHEHVQKNKKLIDQTYLDRNRFGDDATYRALHEFRKRSALHLKMHLEEEKTNKKLVKIHEEISIYRYILKILFDRQLEKSQRIKHCAHMVLRNVARNLNM